MSTPTTSLFAGGPLYSGGPSVIADIQASGFTTVIGFALHLTESGALIFNEKDKTLIQDAEYVGPPDWPSRLSSLKGSSSSVNRLLFSMGGWGTQDFPNLKHQIFPNPGDYPNHPHTGSNSALYQNFQALKQAIPAIDGIDFDDETLYDKPTTVAFARMLHDIGYDVTFCPYTRSQFWVDCLKTLNSDTPNLVTEFNLQCYAGGAGNTPGTWISQIQSAMGSDFDAEGFVFPGLWSRHGQDCRSGMCPKQVGQTLQSWSSSGIEGSFLWLYDDLQNCASSNVCDGNVDTATYAQAMTAALKPKRSAE